MIIIYLQLDVIKEENDSDHFLATSGCGLEDGTNDSLLPRRPHNIPDLND